MPDSTLAAMTAATALDNTELFYVVQGGNDRKATGSQVGNVTISIVDKGTVSSGTVTFDVSAAMRQRLQVGGALTVAFSNWPASGKWGECMIALVNGGSATITWPTVNWHVGDGTTSTTFSNMGITLATSGMNLVHVWTIDGGTTLYGRAI